MSNMADIFVGNMHIFPFLSTWYHPRLFDGFVMLIFLFFCVVCFVSLVLVQCLLSNVSRVSGHVLSIHDNNTFDIYSLTFIYFRAF
jgi:hypothetical protein